MVPKLEDQGEREFAILHLLLNLGLRNKEVARRLNIDPQQVKMVKKKWPLFFWNHPRHTKFHRKWWDEKK